MTSSGNSKSTPTIPVATMERLPRYLMQLYKLRHRNVESINSKTLGASLGLKDTQIRKDLSYFGVFGKARYGYNVVFLVKAIESILGLTREYNIAVVGVGNIGTALANYTLRVNSAFKLKLLIDTSPDLVGKQVAGMRVEHLDDLNELIQVNKIDIALIAVPEKVAVEVAQRLVDAGVSALYNFTQAELHCLKDVYVESANISYGVLRLAHHLSGKWPRKK